MNRSITYVGLDVHKDTIAVALAEAGERSDVREYGKIANTPEAVKALATSCRVAEARFGSATRPDLVGPPITREHADERRPRRYRDNVRFASTKPT